MRLTSIAPGEQGTRETLRMMAGLAREASRDSRFIEFANLFQSAADVHASLSGVYKYQDEEIETLYAPTFNLNYFNQTGELTGDCDDIAMFYAAIFRVLGLPTRFVAMKTKRHDPEFLHVVVESFEDGRWRRYDPTVQPGLVQIDFGRMVEYV